MANQPTKYSKFLIGAASAALVATAVAPVASAADFKDTKGNTHEDAIKALSAAGVISGYTDGTFKPNKTLTRSDVVKMMGKWLVSEGYKVPTDYKTNVRFTDLKSTSNDELLQYAAVVKDNGVFIGSNDRLLAGDDISRENMAVVIVRAFDRVHDIDLASYVAGQTFKKDVTDLGKAKAEARPAIDVLDFFDITNPAAPAFNPKATTTRGQFASFLNKTLTADFSKVTGQVASGVASVKAVNATTVEVEMKDVVTNINSLNFTINGLTVSNAAVKQTDNKTVVLTTAVQKGGEKYTVTLNEKAIGSFTGISNVLPEKVSMITTSQQGVVGNQVTVRAEVTVAKDESKAGIPVTFNIVSDNKSINKDHVVEVKTNADGIAEYSYTQYAAAEDTVQVYATGKANVRAAGMVYWANNAQLTIKDITEATTLVNGSKKVYEINSAKNAGGYVFVTFEENLNVAPDKAVAGAKVEGLTTYVLGGAKDVALATSATAYPYQYTTGGKAVTAVKLDATGKANLVVTGSNASVTPIVYSAKYTLNTLGQFTSIAAYDATDLQAKGSTAKFELKHSLGLTLKAEGVQNAAIWKNAEQTGGRDYSLVYTDKDGKLAAPGTKVKVAISNAGIKGNFNLYNSDGDVLGFNLIAGTRYYEVAVEKDGKASFTVASDSVNDYVSPVAFIDNGKTTGVGVLDADDLQAQGEVTYFVANVAFSAELVAVDKNGKPVSAVIANGAEYADFEYILVDQNGKPRSSTDVTNVAFEVKAGTGAVTVTANGVTTNFNPGDTKTVNAQILANATTASIRVVAINPSAVSVSATGSKAGVVLPSTNPATVTVNFSQYGTAAITGNVSAYNSTLDTLTVNNIVYSYATGVYQYKGSVVTKSAFVGYLAQPNAKISITKDANGNFTFNLLDPAVVNPTPGAVNQTIVDAVNGSATAAAVKNALQGITGFSALLTSDQDAIAATVFATLGTAQTVSTLTTTLGTDITVASDRAVAAKELKVVLDAAQATHNAAVEGSLLGQYASGSKATLQSVINTAKTQYDAAIATGVTPAKAALDAQKVLVNNGLTAFEAGKVTTSSLQAAAVTDVKAAMVTVYNSGTQLATGNAAYATAITELTDNKTVLNLDLTNFNALTTVQKETVLFELAKQNSTTGFTAATLKSALNSAVVRVQDVAAPVLNSIVYDAANDKLVLTFNENVALTGSPTGATIDFTTNGSGGTVATGAVTAVNNKVEITLLSTTATASIFEVGSLVNKLTLTGGTTPEIVDLAFTPNKATTSSVLVVGNLPVK